MTVVRSYSVSNARIAKTDDTAQTVLVPKTLQVTFDKSWTPHVQAQMTLANLTAAQLAAVDPRAGLRLRFTVNQTDPAGVTTATNYDLGLRSRQQSWATGEVLITAASDEALLQDFGYLTPYDPAVLIATAPSYAAQDLAGIVVQNLLGYSLRLDGTTTPTIQVAAADTPIQQGQTGWDYVGQLAEAASAWAWCDELSVLHWTSPAYAAVTSTFTASDADMVIDVQDTVDRDARDFATAVLIAYTGNTPTLYLTSDGNVSPRKTMVLTRAGRRPSNGFATKPRQQAQQRGRSLQVRAAADWRARPNQTWAVSWLGQSATGTVQSVSFELPTGTMDLRVNI